MSNKQLYFFCLVVIFNIFFLFAVIMDVVLPISRPIQACMLMAVNVIYYIKYKGVKSQENAYTNRTPFYICFNLYIALLVLQILISLINENTSTLFLASSLIIICTLFWKCLEISYKQVLSIDVVIKPYLWVCGYTAIASICVFCTLLLGLTDLVNYSIDPTKYDLFNGNFELGGYSIYNPLHLIFVGGSDRGIKFFGQFGPFLGLCHEPHLSSFLLTPALFFFLRKKKHQMLITFIAIANVLLAGSVTNLLLTLFCFIVFLMINYKNISLKIRNIIYLFIWICRYYICYSKYGLYCEYYRFRNY